MTYRETSEDYEFLFNSIKKGVKDIYGFDYKPNILIADNASAIENGFNAAFGDDQITRINCWAHTIRNIDTELAKIKNKEQRERIRFDICNIQLSQSKAIFIKLNELFYLKWLNRENSITYFMSYYRDNWVNRKSGWYEGFSIGDPSTSNAIESHHKTIKKDTQHIRKPAIKFINTSGKELVEEWSNSRNPVFNNQGNFFFSLLNYDLF